MPFVLEYSTVNITWIPKWHNGVLETKKSWTIRQSFICHSYVCIFKYKSILCLFYYIYFFNYKSQFQALLYVTQICQHSSLHRSNWNIYIDKIISQISAPPQGQIIHYRTLHHMNDSAGVSWKAEDADPTDAPGPYSSFSAVRIAHLFFSCCVYSFCSCVLFVV